MKYKQWIEKNLHNIRCCKNCNYCEKRNSLLFYCRHMNKKMVIINSIFYRIDKKCKGYCKKGELYYWFPKSKNGIKRS